MKFFLDANMPHSSCGVFAPYGEVLHARDADLQRAADKEIAQRASEWQAILVTRDLEFGNPYLFPSDAH